MRLVRKRRHYYYFDELNDDFANDGIKGNPTPSGFEYFPKNIFYRLFKPIVYYLFLIVVTIFVRPLSGLRRVHNKQVLRQLKDHKKGYFVFGNHTNMFADALLQPVVSFPRQVYLVSHPDAISIPGMKTFLRMLGAVPIPCSKSTYTSYISAISTMYEKGHPIVVYPEAHIWPKYNKIRNFPDVSFKLPVRLNAPCFVKSTIYHRSRWGWTYPEVWFDGPFYPNMELSEKQAQKELRDRVYAQMIKRCRDSKEDECYYYEKVDSPELVRTEIDIP